MGVIFAAAGAAPRLLGRHDEYLMEIRGERQVLRRSRAEPVAPGFGCKVLLASGDGGFHPFGGVMADHLVRWGYDVYRFDSQRYLSGFTGGTTLTADQCQQDFLGMVAEIRGDDDAPMILMGWSAGAALVVLAGAGERMQSSLAGVAAVALPAEGVLGWRWSDNLQFLPGVRAKGPYFQVAPYLAELPPLPLLVLQSDDDRWVSEEEFLAISAAARAPKRTIMISAGGHSFPDARAEFFDAMRQGLGWIWENGGPRPLDSRTGTHQGQ